MRSGASAGPALRDEVREWLLALLRDDGASAAAKASAGRTLLEHFGADDDRRDRPIDDMTESEIDEEIARLGNAQVNVRDDDSA